MLIGSKWKPNVVISQMTPPPSGFYKRPKEFTKLSSKNLWKRSSNTKGCHYWSRETQCSTTTYHNHPSIFNGQHDVKQGCDQCFQCQEPGHITQHCPYIGCHECKKHGHIVMDCPHKIPPSDTPAQHHKVHRNCHTRSSSIYHWEDWERRDRSRSQSRYSRHYSSSHHDLYSGSPDCNKGMGTATIEAAQGNPIQHTEAIVTEPAVTHHTGHITDHPHTTAHPVTSLRTPVDHVHAYCTDHWNIMHTAEAHAVQHCTPTTEPKNHTLVGTEMFI